ncbi:unnamed protein product [Pieris brassicae]|uniref:Partial AB-hydrolase lipase domain-containing protein n=1 Tax=Pieris brassicae TaxID=7116 RepID=A0A9P0XE42_PIEBR|nr:unnamed protein product [Pieris brassicae]
MKLYVVLFTLCILLQYTDSRYVDWFPQNLVDKFTNKTSQITNYVREKGRSLKQFYVENVRKRITSYLNINQTEDVTDKPMRMRRKFHGYLEDARANGKKVFDVIAPERMEYNCNDNDPGIHMTTPQLIAQHGYPSESHTVVTTDGYILTIHRIPYSKNSTKTSPRKTVLLHHGLLGSSADWIIPGPDKALPYILSEAGYDVWLANVLRAGFALAPVAYMTDIKSPIHLLAKYSANIEYLFKLLGANEFLPPNAVLRWLSKHACEINKLEEAICENSMFVICGHDEGQFNKSLLPLILSHEPAGASTKTLVHYAQEIQTAGRFQQFDYGPDGNLKQYGSPMPPEYPVHKITLPIALISSQNDWLASDVDVTNLYVQLVNPIEHYIVPLKEFNHIDFLWAKDARKLVYNKLLELLEEGVSNSSPYVMQQLLDK